MAIRHVMADGRHPWVSTPFASLNRVYPPTQPKLKPSPCPAVPISHIYPGREMSRCLATPFPEAGPRRACTLRLARCICLPVHLVPPLIPRAVSERPPCRPQGARAILLPGARLARASVFLRPRQTHDGGAGLGGQGRVQPRAGPLRPRLGSTCNIPGEGVPPAISY